tara:strand:- start:1430 stop:1603 length:174 start_codon:yes stop_codon:yes gene_type:complete
LHGVVSQIGAAVSFDAMQGIRCYCLPVLGLCVLRRQDWSAGQREPMRGGAQLFGAHE